MLAPACLMPAPVSLVLALEQEGRCSPVKPRSILDLLHQAFDRLLLRARKLLKNSLNGCSPFRPRSFHFVIDRLTDHGSSTMRTLRPRQCTRCTTRTRRTPSANMAMKNPTCSG